MIDLEHGDLVEFDAPGSWVHGLWGVVRKVKFPFNENRCHDHSHIEVVVPGHGVTGFASARSRTSFGKLSYSAIYALFSNEIASRKVAEILNNANK